MGLTKPRAYQIFDIDYKQAVRVITLTDITLNGGAPSQVDGVNLSVNDRVLVAGNSPASENGIYVVTVVGTGSNGTWIRSVDADQTGEIQAGMVVMVTEGNIYDDTQWKLTTDDPIVVGTTSLTFEQSSAYAFGTVAVSGQSDIVADTVGDTLNFAAGNNIALTTTPGTDTLTISVTGISLNSTISNGTSNVNVVSSGGNVTVGVGGTSNVVVFASAGEYVTGLISASGSITGANVTGSNFLTGGLISATATITGGNLQTGGTISATGNVTGGNVTAATFTGNLISTTVSSSGSITGGNLFTGGEISSTGRIQGANITGGNLLTSGITSATGNVTGGNILTSGVISAAGNITGNYILGNGSQLTGVTAGAQTSIVNGTSNVVVASSGNITVSVAGTAAVATFTTAGFSVSGNVTATTVNGLTLNSGSGDVAERYLADAKYSIGTVLVIGGTQEITQSTGYAQTTVIGTVSDQPALIMNKDLQGEHVTTVAFLGRVPCRVVGNINRGDMLVSSNTEGAATSMESYVPGAVLGKALESYNSDIPGVIEIIVGRL